MNIRNSGDTDGIVNLARAVLGEEAASPSISDRISMEPVLDRDGWADRLRERDITAVRSDVEREINLLNRTPNSSMYRDDTSTNTLDLSSGSSGMTYLNANTDMYNTTGYSTITPGNTSLSIRNDADGSQFNIKSDGTISNLETSFNLFDLLNKVDKMEKMLDSIMNNIPESSISSALNKVRSIV